MDNQVKQQQASVTAKWFINEEFYWRSVASGVWMLLLLPSITMAFIFVVNISLLSPLLWLSDSLSSICSIWMLLSSIILQVFSLFFLFLHARALCASEAHHLSGIKLYLYLLRPKQLLNLMFCMVATLIFCFILLKFVSTSSTSASFISEKETFVIVYGLFLSVVYFVSFYKNHDYVAQFPVVHQKRFFRLKKMISPCLRESVMFSFKVMRIYFPIYILFGFLSTTVSILLNYESESSLLSGAIFLCDTSLLWMCLCVSIATTFVLKMSNYMLQIFNTQLYTFPIDVTFEEQKGKTLSDCMHSENNLLKHLACVDFCLLSRFEGPRRLSIFELTSPGNQPNCWNKISLECLHLIGSLRLKLKSEYDHKQQLRLGAQVSSPAPSILGSQELFSPTSIKDLEDHKKLWWASPGGSMVRKRTNDLSEVQSPAPTVVKKVTEDHERADLFENFQLVIWCIEGLCNLVAASLTEDKYGGVQRKLSDILSELLLFLQTCEMFTKVSPPSLNYIRHVETTQLNSTCTTSLKIAVKTGLYTITTAFGHHISAVRLSPEHKKRLHAFLEFTE